MSFELNQDIEATAFAGEVRERLDSLNLKVDGIDKNVDHIRSQMDKWGGAVAIIGAMVSAAVSFAVALIR